MRIEEVKAEGPPEVPRALSVIVKGIALVGGGLILGAALLVCTSVSLRWATSFSVPGDFELVQIAMALAVFAFLPYCQLRRGNISVDTFTAGLPEVWRSAMDAFWDLAYAAVAAFMAWRLAVGAGETIANGTTTMISGVPIGWVIASVAVLVAVLAATAASTALWRMTGGRT